MLTTHLFLLGPPLSDFERRYTMNPKEQISGEYISPLILIICFCVGHLIKCSFDFIDNRYIPMIVALIGVGMSVWQDGVNPKAIACGLVSGLASTGAFELLRNIWEVF